VVGEKEEISAVWQSQLASGSLSIRLLIAIFYIHPFNFAQSIKIYRLVLKLVFKCMLLALLSHAHKSCRNNLSRKRNGLLILMSEIRAIMAGNIKAMMSSLNDD